MPRRFRQRCRREVELVPAAASQVELEHRVEMSARCAREMSSMRRTGGRRKSRRTARKVGQAKAVGRGCHVEEDRVLADARAHFSAGVARAVAALWSERGKLSRRREDEKKATMHVEGRRKRRCLSVVARAAVRNSSVDGLNQLGKLRRGVLLSRCKIVALDEAGGGGGLDGEGVESSTLGKTDGGGGFDREGVEGCSGGCKWASDKWRRGTRRRGARR